MELDTQKRTRESVTQATKKGRERGRVHALIFFLRTNIKSVIIIFMKLYFLLSTFFFSSFYIYSSFYYKKVIQTSIVIFFVPLQIIEDITPTCVEVRYF